MTDVFSKGKRSEIMSKISGKDTKIEITVRKYLHSKGFRFRKNDNRFIGKPDIVLPKYKTIIFINGCFWHGHYCKKSKLPATNTDFRRSKINRTIERDQTNYRAIQELGWKVLVIWECEINYDFLESICISIKDI